MALTSDHPHMGTPGLVQSSCLAAPLPASPVGTAAAAEAAHEQGQHRCNCAAVTDMEAENQQSVHFAPLLADKVRCCAVLGAQQAHTSTSAGLEETLQLSGPLHMWTAEDLGFVEIVNFSASTGCVRATVVCTGLMRWTEETTQGHGNTNKYSSDEGGEVYRSVRWCKSERHSAAGF